MPEDHNVVANLECPVHPGFYASGPLLDDEGRETGAIYCQHCQRAHHESAVERRYIAVDTLDGLLIDVRHLAQSVADDERPHSPACRAGACLDCWRYGLALLVLNRIEYREMDLTT